MMKLPLSLFALSLTIFSVLASCSDDASQGEPDAGHDDASQGEPDAGYDYAEMSAELFAIDALMQVEIDIDPEDWDTLRYESPGLQHYIDPECPNGFRPRPYDWKPATASVNGEDFGTIEVRKKGLKGSMEPMKPGLKLRFRSGDVPWGVRRMTLNNAIQDRTWAHECLTYHLFRKAGLAAPRCGLARVSVNGNDIGIYTHIEEIKEPLLTSQLGDSGGDLYEITHADFLPELLVMFEFKGDDAVVDRSHLEKVSRALEADDASLFEELEKSLALDWFFDYWALEVITAHWDGYGGNRNNSYVYRHPDDGLFRFIPWGTDQAFREPEDFWGPYLREDDTMPRAVYAHGAIARRLYAHSEGRKRYEERLRALLEEVWDQTELIDMVDTITGTISPELTDALAESTRNAASELKTFIRNHKSRILEELDAGLDDWGHPPNPPLCADAAAKWQTSTVFSGTLQMTFDTYRDDVLDNCDGTAVETTLGEETVLENICGFVSYADTAMGWRNVLLTIAFGPTTNGNLAAIEMLIPEELFESGSTVPLDFGAGRSEVFWIDPSAIIDPSGAAPVKAGFVVNGDLTLNAVDAMPGGRVAIDFNAPAAMLEVP